MSISLIRTGIPDYMPAAAAVKQQASSATVTSAQQVSVSASAPAMAERLPFVPASLFFRGMYGRDEVVLNDITDKTLYPNLLALKKAQETLETTAKERGLDPYPVITHILEPDRFYEIASQKGYPTRYPHWTWGQEYYELKNGDRSFKEVVVHNAPVHSYLLETDPDYGQKTLMAHSIIRSDFFKNNRHYAQSNPKTVALLKEHAELVEGLTQNTNIGFEAVESFLDKAHSIKELIDFQTFNASAANLSIIPSAATPQRDVLGFVMRHSPTMASWQRQLLSMVREESYAMMPHQKTRVMSDGWAVFWNRKINAQNPKMLDIKNLSREASWSSKVFTLNPVSVNAYMLGAIIWEGIARKVLDETPSTGSNNRLQKLFDIRSQAEDGEFIQSHLTQEMAEELLLYLYKPEKGRDTPGTKLKISTRDFDEIRKNLVEMFKNGGFPAIAVIDGNYKNQGELMLKHDHAFDLKKDYAEKTLGFLESLWGKPVHILTKKTDDKGVVKSVQISSNQGKITTTPITEGS